MPPYRAVLGGKSALFNGHPFRVVLLIAAFRAHIGGLSTKKPLENRGSTHKSIGSCGPTPVRPTRGTIAAAFVSGSVSQVTGGKFAVGTATGAMGYLFNQMSGRPACTGRPCRNRSNGPQPSLPQEVVEFLTGYGSGLSFGSTDEVNL